MADRTTLSVVLAALIIVGAFAAQMASMSSELANKNKTIELQKQEIKHYLASISAQKQEAETKTAQLAQLNAEISSKEEEIAATSQQADDLSTELYSQKAELEELRAQAGALQTELGLLQSKINLDEQYIANLTQRLEAITQQSSTERVRISHYGIGVLSDKAVVFPIQVEIISLGTGAVSVDVRGIQYEAAFQSAVRTAATVASDYTGRSISDKDIIVRLVNDDASSQVIKIDGPSAGAIITAMIIAGLTDSVLNDSVLVTGAIKPDGTIGEVGSIENKTDAAIDFGAHMLLVPESQVFKTDQIVVIGVSDIQHVMKYLTVSS